MSTKHRCTSVVAAAAAAAAAALMHVSSSSSVIVHVDAFSPPPSRASPALVRVTKRNRSTTTPTTGSSADPSASVALASYLDDLSESEAQPPAEDFLPAPNGELMEEIEAQAKDALAEAESALAQVESTNGERKEEAFPGRGGVWRTSSGKIVPPPSPPPKIKKEKCPETGEVKEVVVDEDDIKSKIGAALSVGIVFLVAMNALLQSTDVIEDVTAPTTASMAQQQITERSSTQAAQDTTVRAPVIPEKTLAEKIAEAEKKKEAKAAAKLKGDQLEERRGLAEAEASDEYGADSFAESEDDTGAVPRKKMTPAEKAEARAAENKRAAEKAAAVARARIEDQIMEEARGLVEAGGGDEIVSDFEEAGVITKSVAAATEKQEEAAMKEAIARAEKDAKAAANEAVVKAGRAKKEEIEKKATEEKSAVERAAAAERAATEKLAASQRSAVEKAAANKVAAQEKAAIEKVSVEKLAAEKKASTLKTAAEKAAEEKKASNAKAAERDRVKAAVRLSNDRLQEQKGMMEADAGDEYGSDSFGSKGVVVETMTRRAEEEKAQRAAEKRTAAEKLSDTERARIKAAVRLSNNRLQEQKGMMEADAGDEFGSDSFGSKGVVVETMTRRAEEEEAQRLAEERAVVNKLSEADRERAKAAAKAENERIAQERAALEKDAADEYGFIDDSKLKKDTPIVSFDSSSPSAEAKSSIPSSAPPAPKTETNVGSPSEKAPGKTYETSKPSFAVFSQRL